jgi:dTDP-4-amino-4,6-dideoxygalactose transaminase
MGRSAAFSFYPGKNLGACGEAGAITTNDAGVAETTRRLRDHGQTKKYFHETEGYNGRLDAIQAGLLQAKLAHLEQWNAARRLNAAEYNRLLAGNEAIIGPHEPAWSRAVYHLYVIRTANRDGLIRQLSAAAVGTGIHYPIPLHMQNAYSWMNYSPTDFPVSARISAEIMSLPMFPQLTAEQQKRVVAEVYAFTSKSQCLPPQPDIELAAQVAQTA